MPAAPLLIFEPNNRTISVMSLPSCKYRGKWSVRIWAYLHPLNWYSLSWSSAPCCLCCNSPATFPPSRIAKDTAFSDRPFFRRTVFYHPWTGWSHLPHGPVGCAPSGFCTDSFQSRPPLPLLSSFISIATLVCFPNPIWSIGSTFSAPAPALRSRWTLLPHDHIEKQIPPGSLTFASLCGSC